MEDIMEFTESDLAAVGKIQENRGCTIAKAKEVYRKHVLTLANPDVENRADLVLEAMDRGVDVASDEEVEETVTKKAKKQRAPKAAKAAKPKAEKTKKPSKAVT